MSEAPKRCCMFCLLISCRWGQQTLRLTTLLTNTFQLMTSCDFGAPALSQFQCAISSKSKEEYRHLGSQTLTGNQMLKCSAKTVEQSMAIGIPVRWWGTGTIEGIQIPNFQSWVFSSFKIASKSPKLNSISQLHQSFGWIWDHWIRMELLPGKTVGPTGCWQADLLLTFHMRSACSLRILTHTGSKPLHWRVQWFFGFEENACWTKHRDSRARSSFSSVSNFRSGSQSVSHWAAWKAWRSEAVISFWSSQLATQPSQTRLDYTWGAFRKYSPLLNPN